MVRIDADALLDDFAIEAGTHTDTIESAFLDLGSLAGSPKLIDSVFRAAHSIKGTAGFFSLKKIVNAAHELESVFSKIKAGQLQPDEELADAVLEGVDCLRALINNISAQDAVDINPFLDKLGKYSAVGAVLDTAESEQMTFDLADPEIKKRIESAAPRGHRTYYLRIVSPRELGRYSGNPKKLISDITSVGSVIKIAVNGEISDFSESFAAKIPEDGGAFPVLELLVTSVLEPELFLVAVELDARLVHYVSKETVSGTGSVRTQNPPSVSDTVTREAKSDFSIRLDVSAVNELMDLSNEMILIRNRFLSLVSEHARRIPGLMPVLQDITRLTGEIQEKAMRNRMQPANMLFGKFPRIIRDTAKALGKDIKIEISGGDTALDKYLLDSLSDPITQLVKNAADHGIEKAADRAAAGKPEFGTISLGAYTRDGIAVIEVSDDGSGIDTEALKKKGVERGISEERLGEMSRDALFSLIFEPGFSTAKTLTNLSGRGVGMDIVKTNIEKLGGFIEVVSEMGKGTSVRLKIPLTLSVIRTLIVVIDSVTYAVPEINVERIVRVSDSGVCLERAGDALALNLGGWIVPAVTMDSVNAAARGLSPIPPKRPLEISNGKNAAKCLVLKSSGRYFALLTDDALKAEETLISPLPVYLRGCRCYSGAAVLGGGNAVAILDAEGIMRLMNIHGVEKSIPAETVSQSGEDARRVIIFQCSGPEYYAADADEITKISRVPSGDIQKMGDRQYVNIGGKTLSVIFPEDYVPVRKGDYAKEYLYLLTVNTAELPAGLLASRVLDRVEEPFSLESGRFKSDYVLGTGAYREKVLIFLNAAMMARTGTAVSAKQGGGVKKSGH